MILCGMNQQGWEEENFKYQEKLKRKLFTDGRVGGENGASGGGLTFHIHKHTPFIDRSINEQEKSEGEMIVTGILNSSRLPMGEVRKLCGIWKKKKIKNRNVNRSKPL